MGEFIKELHFLVKLHRKLGEKLRTKTSILCFTKVLTQCAVARA